MGKGKDMTTATKRNDDDFPYEPAGVYRLLKEWHRLESRIESSGDYDTLVIIEDVKKALDSDILTPRQRQVVALYFFADIGMEYVGEVLGIGAPRVKKHLVLALDRLSGHMKTGGAVKHTKGREVTSYGNSRPLFRWLNQVGHALLPVYDVPEEVYADLLDWLSENGDERAQEVARQLRHGPPEVEYIYENPEDVYPCLNPRQMQYRETKQIPVPEVYPKFDEAGRRKAHVYQDGTVVEKVKKILVIPR
jgi:hypothetical protein